MWKSTRSKTKSESELSESESELSWLLICSAPSCWNWHPPLLFTLFSLKAIGGHKPHYWCLVEFGSAVQNKVCLAGCVYASVCQCKFFLHHHFVRHPHTYPDMYKVTSQNHQSNQFLGGSIPLSVRHKHNSCLLFAPVGSSGHQRTQWI